MKIKPNEDNVFVFKIRTFLALSIYSQQMFPTFNCSIILIMVIHTTFCISLVILANRFCKLCTLHFNLHFMSAISQNESSGDTNNGRPPMDIFRAIFGNSDSSDDSDDDKQEKNDPPVAVNNTPAPVAATSSVQISLPDSVATDTNITFKISPVITTSNEEALKIASVEVVTVSASTGVDRSSIGMGSVGEYFVGVCFII